MIPMVHFCLTLPGIWQIDIVVKVQTDLGLSRAAGATGLFNVFQRRSSDECEIKEVG